MNNNREKEISIFGMEKKYVIADFEMEKEIVGNDKAYIIINGILSDAQASMDMCNFQDARQYLNQTKLLISHNNKKEVA